jgi:hypothetical protein
MVRKIVIVARFGCSECLGFSYTLESEHEPESLNDLRNSDINTVPSRRQETTIMWSIDMEFDHRRGCDVIAISVAFEQTHWADVDREWRLSFTLAVCLIGYYASAFHS